MPCRHQFSDHALRRLGARPVVAVERPAREIDIELRAAGGELLAKSVEHFDRQSARIGRCLDHDRRHGADQHQLGDAALRLAMPRDVARRLAAAGRMADVHGIAQIEMLDDREGVGGVVIHVVTVADLGRAAVTAAIVGDDAETLVEEKEHLRVPVVGAQRPAVVEHDGLRTIGAPVLVENLDAVFGRNHAHHCGPFRSGSWDSRLK